MDSQHVIAEDRRRLARALRLSLFFVLGLWAIWTIEQILGLNLAVFGILPRSLSGLIGIPLAPFIHDSLRHIVSNTAPAFVLGTALLYAYPRASRLALPIIYVGSGLAVWLFARGNVHIGASGVVHGMMFFLFIIGILRRDRLSIAVAMMVLFLYGSMIWGIVPGAPDISWESHLAGAVLGAVTAYLFSNLDAARAEKRYDWEEEDEGEAEIYIMDRRRR